MFWQMSYFLLEYYLFAVAGAMAYLSARAWFDPLVAARRHVSSKSSPRWPNFVRCLGFVGLATAAFVRAVYREDFVSAHSDIALFFVRLASYIIAIALLPRAARLSRPVIIGAAVVAIGEGLMVSHGAAPFWHGHSEFAGTLLIDIGVTVLAFALKAHLFRLRLVDRLVIAFAIFGMMLAQLVAVLFLLLEENIVQGGITGQQVNALIANADRPMVITLTAVLVTSAVIGFFLARDLSAPMTRLERAIKAIGEGELEYQVQLRGSGDDEMHDLARELNRMAQKLKAAESMRAEFFSFVSHELRSPLTSMRGFVETLQAAPDFTDIDRREIYEIIHEESDRLLRMIGELLDISRIEAGSPLSLQKQRFEAGRHLERVAEIMRGHTRLHTLKVIKKSSPAWIEADPDKFDQILINLVSNAIKYSPDGGDVILKLEETPDALRISITDSGVGMDATHCEHIFEKFYRVSEKNSVTHNRLSRIEGAGIGLYLTRALVEAHGGKISVASEVGVGSTFSVELPRGAGVDGASSDDDNRPRPLHNRPIDLERPPVLQREIEAVAPAAE